MVTTIPYAATVSELDREAFEARLADRIAALRSVRPGPGPQPVAKPGIGAADRASLEAARRVITQSGDRVLLQVYAGPGSARLEARTFEVRVPRMRSLMAALFPVVELLMAEGGLSPEAAQSSESTARLMRLLQTHAMTGDSPLGRAVGGLVNEVFGQPAGEDFLGELPWDSAMRALEVVVDLVPFGHLARCLNDLTQRAMAGAQMLGG